MKDTRNLSSLIVGQVMDRALMEIKDVLGKGDGGKSNEAINSQM
jgi:hypothetical protein